MSRQQQYEQDASCYIVDPFAGVFRLNRLLVYLSGLALVTVVILGALLWHVAARASVHAFEIYPDGKAVFIEDRESRILARDYEARYLAKEFIQYLYGWSSESITRDLAAGVSVCSKQYADKLRRGFAQSRLVENISSREAGVRSELEFKAVEIKEHTKQLSRVRVILQIRRFRLSQYEGPPLEERSLELQVTLEPRRRSQRWPNALAIVRLQEYRASIETEKVGA